MTVARIAQGVGGLCLLAIPGWAFVNWFLFCGGIPLRATSATWWYIDAAVFAVLGLVGLAGLLIGGQLRS